jgi:hypothetical protein
MTVLNLSFAYVNTPPFFSGTSSTNLVPNVFPVAIDGRPFMIDQRSGRFTRGYEPRVRDSQDISTAPGEAAINPGGLWRRGQDSWHLGAGQKYADAAQAIDYRFYKSKGVNPWTRGQLSLLNATKLSLSTSSTNLMMCVVKSSGGTEYLYVADGSTLKYTTDPFAGTPTWTSVTTGSPGTAITGLESNGENVFIGYTSNDIYYTTPGSASVSSFYPTSGTANQTYTGFGYAKGWGIASVNNKLYVIGLGSGGHNLHYTNPDTTFRWVGAAAGQNAVYAAGNAGTHSIVYKMTLKTDASGLDQPVAALELPVGETISSIFGYLGFILLGTSKGVRFCTTDSQNNLVSGPVISTTSEVKGFSAEDKYIWFGWTNYDSTSGLGRLDLSSFTGSNAPAFATDLMYASSTNAVNDVTTVAGKRVFSISGVGVVVENTAALVSSGTIEVGTYRWGIPDRKFVAKVDTRSEPLKGSITSYMALDNAAYTNLGAWSTSDDVENTLDGSSQKAIQAGFKFELKPSDSNESPVLTRWMCRAYAAPFRSQVFSIPVLLHRKVRVGNKDYYYDTADERQGFDDLIASPRIITLQLGELTHTVIVEDVEEIPVDSSGNVWDFEGTLVVTMRSVEN